MYIDRTCSILPEQLCHCFDDLNSKVLQVILGIGNLFVSGKILILNEYYCRKELWKARAEEAKRIYRETGRLDVAELPGQAFTNSGSLPQDY